MTQRIIWNGTTDEALALLHALSVHCACEIQEGRTVAACPAHLMLAYDQRAVDGLLFMRRMAERLLAEEFAIAERSTADALAEPTAHPLAEPTARPLAKPTGDPLADPNSDPLTEPLPAR